MGLKEILPGIIAALALLMINCVAFCLMGVDKKRAKLRAAGASEKKVRRISEATLLLWAGCFGAIGATLGMLLFRHKTRHWYFRIGLPVMMVIQLVLLTLHLWLDPLMAFVTGVM